MPCGNDEMYKEEKRTDYLIGAGAGAVSGLISVGLNYFTETPIFSYSILPIVGALTVAMFRDNLRASGISLVASGAIFLGYLAGNSVGYSQAVKDKGVEGVVLKEDKTANVLRKDGSRTPCLESGIFESAELGRGRYYEPVNRLEQRGLESLAEEQKRLNDEQQEITEKHKRELREYYASFLGAPASQPSKE
jgi:hypothetical protein